MSGQEKRHGFVANLAVVHLAAVVFIASIEQQRKEIVLALAALAPLADEAKKNRVELLERLFEAPVCGRGEPDGGEKEAIEAREKVGLQDVHGFDDMAGFAADLGAE